MTRFALIGALAASNVALGQSVQDVRTGLLDLIQVDPDNDWTSILVEIPASSTLFSEPKHNRADVDVGFGSGDDLNRGIAFVSPRSLARDNASGGGNLGGDLFATLAINRNEGGRNQFVAMFGSPSGQEMNVDAALAWFPFDAGFIAGHAWNSENNAALSTMVASPGLELGDDLVDQASTNGIYDLDLSDVGGHSSQGVLLVCGGKNEDNYALSRANADGTFTIYCKDNGSNGQSYENDPVAFVYLPFDVEGLVAARITERSGATPTVIASTTGFTLSPDGPGRVIVRIEGVTSDHQGVMLVSPEGGDSRNTDNIVVASWDESEGGYAIETRDLVGMGLQGLDGEPMCSFAYIPIIPGEGFEARPETSTIVALPDTQLYAQNVPEIFDMQTAWVAAETDARDVRMLLHLGDITNRNTFPQWTEAREAYDNVIDVTPYILAQGNHDVGPNGNGADRSTFMNIFFPLGMVSQQPTFGGSMEGRVENTYSLFEWAGRKWITIALEWGPRDVVLDWANDVLSAHEDRLAIIITHAYMYNDDTRMDQTVRDYGGSPYNYGTADGPGGTNDGGDIWREVASQHPNVVMTISGHISGEGYQASPTVFGNVVHEMLADYQNRPEGGEGFLRYYELTPDTDIMRVRTYSPWQDRHLTGSKSHFEFQLVTAPGHDGRICDADVNDDGILDVFDIFAFLNLFTAQDPGADLAEPFGTFDVFDLLAYLGVFDEGC